MDKAMRRSARLWRGLGGAIVWAIPVLEVSGKYDLESRARRDEQKTPMLNFVFPAKVIFLPRNRA